MKIKILALLTITFFFSAKLFSQNLRINSGGNIRTPQTIIKKQVLSDSINDDVSSTQPIFKTPVFQSTVSLNNDKPIRPAGGMSQIRIPQQILKTRLRAVQSENNQMEDYVAIVNTEKPGNNVGNSQKPIKVIKQRIILNNNRDTVSHQ